MNDHSTEPGEIESVADTRPILVVPYMWIGDFVRGHTVVRVFKERWPNRPVTIGNPASHSPEDARGEANRIKGQAAAGADPAAEAPRSLAACERPRTAYRCRS